MACVFWIGSFDVSEDNTALLALFNHHTGFHNTCFRQKFAGAGTTFPERLSNAPRTSVAWARTSHPLVL